MATTWTPPRMVRTRYVVEERREPGTCGRDTHTEPEPAPFNAQTEEYRLDGGSRRLGDPWPVCRQHAVEWLAASL